MSFIDSVLANTAGVAYSAWTGRVDPWTKANITEATQASIDQAMGTNASPAEIADANASAANLITQTLETTPGGSSNPGSLALHVPGLGDFGSPDFLKKIDGLVNGAIAIGVLILAFYLYQAYGSRVQRTFRRR